MFGRVGPLENFKEVFRKKHDPIYCLPGDSIVYTYKDGINPELVLAVDTIDKAICVDEIVAFRATFEGRDALGGLLLEQKSDAELRSRK